MIRPRPPSRVSLPQSPEAAPRVPLPASSGPASMLAAPRLFLPTLPSAGGGPAEGRSTGLGAASCPAVPSVTCSRDTLSEPPQFPLLRSTNPPGAAELMEAAVALSVTAQRPWPDTPRARERNHSVPAPQPRWLGPARRLGTVNPRAGTFWADLPSSRARTAGRFGPTHNPVALKCRGSSGGISTAFGSCEASLSVPHQQRERCLFWLLGAA